MGEGAAGPRPWAVQGRQQVVWLPLLVGTVCMIDERASQTPFTLTKDTESSRIECQRSSEYVTRLYLSHKAAAFERAVVVVTCAATYWCLTLKGASIGSWNCFSVVQLLPRHSV